MDASTTDPIPELFPTRADAALFLSGFAACWTGLALLGAGAIWLGSAPSTSIILVPVVALELGAIILYRMGLNRLERRLTGSEPRIPFYLYVSPRTMLKSLRPSVISAAAVKLGLEPVVTLAVLYVILGCSLAEMVVAAAK
jgi:hypothetical protein